MNRLFKSTCLLLAGVFAGWWLRDLAYERPSLPGEEGTAPPAINTHVVPPAPTDSAAINPLEVREPAASPDTVSFEALLDQREYKEAIEYYETSLQLEENSRTLLKPGLEDHLKARVQDCADGDFIDLVDLWLESYYADIEVLLLLAEHQRICSSSEEAARTLQIASTYAIRPGQRESVSAAVVRLIAATDERLARQQDWITLLGFYEFLDVIDLETNASQLRRAWLYQRIGEVWHGRELLLQLRENDDGLDAEWTAALDRQLADTTPQPVADESSGFEVALTRRGNHYLVPAVLNGDSPLSLIIDTGASVTTLSRESFERIESRDVRYLGTQLFNTPNGITQGDVYRARSIQLGEAKMRDLEIAVLEFESADGFDGLLGMNVLRNYRFEIDQDRDVLHMSPRL